METKYERRGKFRPAPKTCRPREQKAADIRAVLAQQAAANMRLEASTGWECGKTESGLIFWTG